MFFLPLIVLVNEWVKIKDTLSVTAVAVSTGFFRPFLLFYDTLPEPLCYVFWYQKTVIAAILPSIMHENERVRKRVNEPHFKQSLHLDLTAADPVDVVAVIINVVFAICIRWWKTRRIDVGSFACLFPFLMKTSWNRGFSDVNVDVQTIIVAAAAEFPLPCLPLFSYVYGTTKSVTLKRTPNPNTRETTQCPGAWQSDINFSLFRIR